MTPTLTPEQRANLGKATPGPWSIVPYGDGESLVIHSSEDIRVCFMATPGAPSRDNCGIRANARLIAAAPELLNALQSALALIDDMSRFVGQMSLQDYQAFNEAPMNARAAITKATGQ